MPIKKQKTTRERRKFPFGPTILALVLFVALGITAYLIYKEQTLKLASSATSGAPNSLALPPQINKATDLPAAYQSLNQTSVSSSNADATQIGNQLNGF